MKNFKKRESVLGFNFPSLLCDSLSLSPLVAKRKTNH